MLITKKRLEAVVATALSDIVPDFRPLMAALFLSHPVESQFLNQFVQEQPEIAFLLKGVEKLRKHGSFFNSFVEGGFFNEQLEHLLLVAKGDPVAGSRLMPVFCAALNVADEIMLSKDLEAKIINYIEAKRLEDGFAIRYMEPGNIEYVLAPGAEEAEDLK